MNRYRELRKEANYSQLQLAEKLFVNQTAVSQWERGVTTPSQSIQLKLCELYDTTLDYLSGRTEIKKAPDTEYDVEGDKDILEMIELMDALPKNERKRAVRFLRAAYADMEEIPEEDTVGDE